MKRIFAFLRAVRGRRLVALCYAVFFAASVLVCLYGFAEDSVQRMRGNVREQEVALRDFTLTDLAENADGSLTSESPDPRMVLNNVPEYVRSLTVRAEFINMDPGEFCLFYMPRPGMEEFDVSYRIWARQEDDGSYTFTLPRGKVYGLRLDPGIYTGLTFRIEQMTLNAPRSFLSWFVPGRVWLLCQLTVPALAAGVIEYLRGALGVCAAFWRARKKGS